MPRLLAAAATCVILVGSTVPALADNLWETCPRGLACQDDAAAHVASLLTRYTETHGPLTPYARDLVAALQSMDADLASATAPVLRNLGNQTVPIHPLGFSIPPHYVREVVPAKGQALATVVPGSPDTYKFLGKALKY